jgi:hypothetical protein
MPPDIQDFVDFARFISQTCQYRESVLSDLHKFAPLPSRNTHGDQSAG